MSSQGIEYDLETGGFQDCREMNLCRQEVLESAIMIIIKFTRSSSRLDATDYGLIHV
ncbi:MAG: hypothetical protein QGF78_00720 [Candidatus Bathyarchaeota archaeon]|nr:hypothetical protein [Candidatus Bathyarchaeota archaeon]